MLSNPVRWIAAQFCRVMTFVMLQFFVLNRFSSVKQKGRADPEAVLFLIAELLEPKHLRALGRTNKHYSSSVRSIVRERSANQIAHFWRRYGWCMNTKNLAQAFLAAKLSDVDARASQFDDFVGHLRKKIVIKIALFFVRRVIYSSADILKIRIDGKKYNIRVFLAAYMVEYFPQHIFDRVDASVQDLMAAAHPLLACVQSIAERLAQHGSYRELPSELVAGPLKLIDAYEAAFGLWKVPDLDKLVARIVNAIHGLLLAFRTVDPYDPFMEDTRENFRGNFRRLFDKLVNLNGRDSLKQFERSMVRTLSYETFDPVNPVDWELWANYHMQALFDAHTPEYWEEWATERMYLLLA